MKADESSSAPRTPSSASKAPMTYTEYRKMKADKVKKKDDTNGEVELLAHYKNVTGADMYNMDEHYQDY